MIRMVQAHPKREQWGTGESAFYWGDSAQKLENALQDHQGRVQLVYMDPPFMTGGTYRFIQRVGEAGWQGNPRYQVAHNTYHDQYRGGMEEYLAFLRPVVERCRALLTDTGCIAVHVDWRTSAHIRLLLDELFGREHFVNEIIWAYQSGGRSERHFSRKHDSIFLYSKGSGLAFYPEAVGVPRGRTRRNHLKRSVDEDGRVYFSIRVSGKEYRYYEDDLIFPSDVWTDIAPLQQKDPERTGYETQKPMALLERLIRALTLPGEWVCDPFSGSGTTAEAASALNRRVLALDQDRFSLHLFRRRMLARGGNFLLANLPEDSEACRGRPTGAGSRSRQGGITGMAGAGPGIFHSAFASAPRGYAGGFLGPGPSGGRYLLRWALFHAQPPFARPGEPAQPAGGGRDALRHGGGRIWHHHLLGFIVADGGRAVIGKVHANA